MCEATEDPDPEGKARDGCILGEGGISFQEFFGCPISFCQNNKGLMSTSFEDRIAAGFPDLPRNEADQSKSPIPVDFAPTLIDKQLIEPASNSSKPLKVDLVGEGKGKPHQLSPGAQKKNVLYRFFIILTEGTTGIRDNFPSVKVKSGWNSISHNPPKEVFNFWEGTDFPQGFPNQNRIGNRGMGASSKAQSIYRVETVVPRLNRVDPIGGRP